ncbi:MAG: YlxR family protein [Oscillospiraceae bacterium]
MQIKKIPQRKCSVCMQMKPKKELIRIVKTKENDFFVDQTGKKSGRGAYVCLNNECIKKARLSHAFERAFKGKVPQKVYDDLDELFNAEEKNID